MRKGDGGKGGLGGGRGKEEKGGNGKRKGKKSISFHKESVAIRQLTTDHSLGLCVLCFMEGEKPKKNPRSKGEPNDHNSTHMSSNTRL